ncbi:hypothetical protein ABZP36_033907 [Zizania latifolia]
MHVEIVPFILPYKALHRIGPTGTVHRKFRRQEPYELARGRASEGLGSGERLSRQGNSLAAAGGGDERQAPSHRAGSHPSGGGEGSDTKNCFVWMHQNIEIDRLN